MQYNIHTLYHSSVHPVILLFHLYFHLSIISPCVHYI